MARKNRTVVPDAIYHVSSVTVNRVPYLSDPEFKDRIVDWIYGIADFSGIEVLAWSILEDRMDLYVHVPNVPRQLRTKSTVPASYAFGMRPPECNVPLWEDPPIDGDSPRKMRPDLNFWLTDEEMYEKLNYLYAETNGVAVIRRRWQRWRRKGNDEMVDEEKSRFCRRMYNVTQYMKTLKERIVCQYRRNHRQTGHFWEERFRSAVVENAPEVVQNAVADIDYAPIRSGCRTSQFRWNSFFRACGDHAHSERCRRGYEKIYGCSWNRAKKLVQMIFSDSPRQAGSESTTKKGPCTRLRVSQAIKHEVPVLSKGAFIGISDSFIQFIRHAVPIGFPGSSVERDVNRCRMMRWVTAENLAA